MRVRIKARCTIFEAMRVLIVGCGYVGVALGVELVRQGHEVFGVRRSGRIDPRLHDSKIQFLQADVTQRESLETLPQPWDWVVNLVSSTHGTAVDYSQVYLEGTRNLIDWISHHPVRKFLYTSSTSVYAQTDGAQVKETSPTEPTSETAQVLVQTEQLLLSTYREKKLPAVFLRVAGIYGPKRSHFLAQFIGNQVKIYGHGERHMNMVHLDDLVGIIQAALKNGRAGEIYNVVDDEPVMEVHFYRWLSETLGKWMPPFAPAEEKPESKRGLTDKKVLNRKLKMELGYQFRYPTFRQGYSAEIERLERAGLLNIPPEPR